jgi:hypothetical protein
VTAGIINTPRDVAMLNALEVVIKMARIGGPEAYATLSWRDEDTGLLISIGATAPAPTNDDEEPGDVDEPLF